VAYRPARAVRSPRNLKTTARARPRDPSMTKLGSGGAITLYELPDPDLADSRGLLHHADNGQTGSGLSIARRGRLMDTRIQPRGATHGTRGHHHRFVFAPRFFRRTGRVVFGCCSGDGVSAVIVKTTITPPTAGGYVTAYPSASRPYRSTINFVARRDTSHRTLLPLGSAGKINFYK